LLVPTELVGLKQMLQSKWKCELCELYFHSNVSEGLLMSNYTYNRAVSIPTFQCLCWNDPSSLRYSLKFRVCSSLETIKFLSIVFILELKSFMGKMCQRVEIALVNVHYFWHAWVSILKRCFGREICLEQYWLTLKLKLVLCKSQKIE
jgi:hypothetical protein